jgi:GNAT superfamily N-acetyltransferase
LDQNKKHLELVTSPQQMEVVEKLALIVWNQHYVPIIGQSQVDYMLDKFQSFKAIQSQIAEGYIYYILYQGETPLGYCSLLKEADTLFISKLYILKDFRGQNNGSFFLSFIEEFAQNLACNSLKLTVNKNNTQTINFYTHSGFSIKREVVFDIGNQYVMDDYEMVKLLFL